jgi:predicted outer membrane repeat protein
MSDSLAFFEVHDSSFLNNTAIRMGGAIRVRGKIVLRRIYHRKVLLMNKF